MNTHNSQRMRFLAVLTLVLGIAASASAAFFIVTPPRVVLPTLRTYPQAAASWWKWAAAQSVDESAILDPTGERCANGQPALGIWYLAGGASAEPVRRTCTVPKFRTLLIPVMNYVVAAFDSDPPEDREEKVLRAQARDIADATHLKLTIDGVEVRNVKRFYVESTLFTVTLPENNLFGADPGQVLDPAVDAGYYVAITGLLPGKHTLSWSGHSDTLEFSQDVSYEITIRGF